MNKVRMAIGKGGTFAKVRSCVLTNRRVALVLVLIFVTTAMFKEHPPFLGW